jgi:hypothetical protein
MRVSLVMGVLLAAIPSMALGSVSVGHDLRSAGVPSVFEPPPSDLPLLSIASGWPSTPPPPHTETFEVVETLDEPRPLERFSAALYYYPFPPGIVGTPENPHELGSGLKVAEISPLSDGAEDGVLSFEDRDGDGMLSAGDRFTIVQVDRPVCIVESGDPPCGPTWDVYEFGLSYLGYGWYWIEWPVVLVPSSGS